MTNVKIITKEFISDTGEITPYRRLAIIGEIQGEPYTLELKLNKSELMLADVLLKGKANQSEITYTTEATGTSEYKKQQIEKAIQNDVSNENFNEGFNLK